MTTVERVLLDLAGARDLQPLRRAWEEAQRRGLLDVRKVAEIIENSPGRRTKPLRALLEEATDAPDTRSEFEDRFTDFLREHPDLPQGRRRRLRPQGRRPDPQARSAEPQGRRPDPQARSAEP